jgi:Mg2+ and Co2+ transporter CorA
MTDAQDRGHEATQCRCCQIRENTAQWRGVELCDECIDFLKPRLDELQARVQELEQDIENRKASHMKWAEHADRLIADLEREVAQLKGTPKEPA